MFASREQSQCPSRSPSRRSPTYRTWPRANLARILAITLGQKSLQRFSDARRRLRQPVPFGSSPSRLRFRDTSPGAEPRLSPSSIPTALRTELAHWNPAVPSSGAPCPRPTLVRTQSPQYSKKIILRLFTRTCSNSPRRQFASRKQLKHRPARFSVVGTRFLEIRIEIQIGMVKPIPALSWRTTSSKAARFTTMPVSASTAPPTTPLPCSCARAHAGYCTFHRPPDSPPPTARRCAAGGLALSVVRRPK